MIRFITAGESHGKCLTGILEGLPAGLPVSAEAIDLQLRRRQVGYGRGGRMRIERDEIEITAGVRHGRTLGGPVSFVIQNRDWSHWRIAMSVEPVEEDANVRPITRPRPGHVDLAGALKYGTYDSRDVLERASARETAARVAGGSFCRVLLEAFGIRIGSHVVAIGTEHVSGEYENLEPGKIMEIDPFSPMRCADAAAESRMKALIDRAKEMGDTIGGVAEIVASPVPPGLGSHTQWDRRLDGRIALCMMSIPAAKAVEIGSGIEASASFGSAVHDEIFYDRERRRFFRETNRAGGIEAGISNGGDIRVRLYVKPIPTLRKPLRSVDLRTKEPFEAAFERSDTCVVPAAAVIGEAMLALALAEAFMEKFGGDSIAETRSNFEQYLRSLEQY
ncbi:MAG: chorismate synthase [Acidobacteria bacterium]|nr:chorismate synthase [Acidobacteriota bacterium]